MACLEGKLWVRISAQYYNTLDDYAALAGAVQQIMAEGAQSTECQTVAAPAVSQATLNGHCTV